MKESTKNLILSFDERGRYMLLSRMVEDCKYYVRHPHEKYLWALSIEEQIEAMRFVYELFNEDAKPEWCGIEDIDRFEASMKAAANAA